MKKYKPYLTRVDLVKNQVERERIQEQEAAKKRKRRAQQQNAQRWLKYQEQLRSELTARYFHGVVSAGGDTDTFTNTYSVALDGTDDYINCGNTGLLNGGTELTMAGWFKTTNKTLDQVFFSTFAGKTYAEISMLSGALYCWIGNGVSTSNYNIVNAANLGISNDTWFHLTLVFDGSQSTNDTRLKVYKNGDLLPWTTVRTIPTTLGTSTATTYIGARNTSFEFSGNIDEVAFWHSLPNVTDIYTGTSATDLSALNSISWWRMGDNDGGTGTTVTDQGSGGNNGTLISDATFEEDVPS